MDIIRKEGYREPTAKTSGEGYEIERVYVVANYDTTDDMEMRILTHEDMPQVGDVYSEDYPRIKVTDVSIDMPNELNFLNWEAKVTYKTVTDSEGDPNYDLGAILWERDVSVSGTGSRFEEAITKAYDSEGNQTVDIESTTGEPLSGVFKYDSREQLTITQNVYPFDFNLLKLNNQINENNETIAGVEIEAGYCIITGINATPNVDANGNKYYTQTVNVEISDQEYLARVANRGYKRIGFNNEDTEKYYYILKSEVSGEDIDSDTGKERIDEPAKIGASGYTYAPNATHTLSTPIIGRGADYLEFNVYKKADFSPLNLPSDKQ